MRKGAQGRRVLLVACCVLLGLGFGYSLSQAGNDPHRLLHRRRLRSGERRWVPAPGERERELISVETPYLGRIN